MKKFAVLAIAVLSLAIAAFSQAVPSGQLSFNALNGPFGWLAGHLRILRNQHLRFASGRQLPVSCSERKFLRSELSVLARQVHVSAAREYKHLVQQVLDLRECGAGVGGPRSATRPRITLAGDSEWASFTIRPEREDTRSLCLIFTRSDWPLIQLADSRPSLRSASISASGITNLPRKRRLSALKNRTRSERLKN